jgi:hypothetical protein
VRDVFLSHSDHDRSVARAVTDALEARGSTTWYYERDCVVGQKHLVTTGNAIDNCRVFLVIISKAAIDSDFVFPEVLRAVERTRPLVPVLLGMSHGDLAGYSLRWAEAIGFHTSVRWDTQPTHEALEKIVKGVHTLLRCPAASGLSQEELDRLTRESVDPYSWGTDALTQDRSRDENASLSDEQLVRIIESRNEMRKPTYKLRLEYRRRLLARSKQSRN